MLFSTLSLMLSALTFTNGFTYSDTSELYGGSVLEVLDEEVGYIEDDDILFACDLTGVAHGEVDVEQTYKDFVTIRVIPHFSYSEVGRNPYFECDFISRYARYVSPSFFVGVVSSYYNDDQNLWEYTDEIYTQTLSSYVPLMFDDGVRQDYTLTTLRVDFPYNRWDGLTPPHVFFNLYFVYTTCEELDPTIDPTYNDVFSNGYHTGYNDGLNDGTTEGYTNGYNTGVSEGTQTGYNTGYTNGYNEGYDTALSTHDFSFTNLFASLADTPVLMIRRLFGFELFGTSLIAVFMSLLTALIVIHLIKRVF